MTDPIRMNETDKCVVLVKQLEREFQTEIKANLATLDPWPRKTNFEDIYIYVYFEDSPSFRIKISAEVDVLYIEACLPLLEMSPFKRGKMGVEPRWVPKSRYYFDKKDFKRPDNGRLRMHVSDGKPDPKVVAQNLERIENSVRGAFECSAMNFILDLEEEDDEAVQRAKSVRKVWRVSDDELREEDKPVDPSVLPLFK